MARISIGCSSAAFLVLGLILGPLSAGEARAQTDDHLKCYQIKGDLKLKGFVDIETPQFGLERDCKIGKPKFFCVPATKSNVEVVDGKTKQPITPLPLGAAPAPGDRICWQVKCPQPFPSDQVVTDQFGTQTLTKFKTKLLCTPAFKGEPVTFKGVEVSPVGSAVLSVVGDPPNETLAISNISSSGGDGIFIDVRNALEIDISYDLEFVTGLQRAKNYNSSKSNTAHVMPPNGGGPGGDIVLMAINYNSSKSNTAHVVGVTGGVDTSTKTWRALLGETVVAEVTGEPGGDIGSATFEIGGDPNTIIPVLPLAINYNSSKSNTAHVAFLGGPGLVELPGCDIVMADAIEIIEVGNAIPEPFRSGMRVLFTNVNSVAVKTLSVSYCGNGVLDPGEECDDGNLEDGDGCSPMCLLQAGGCVTPPPNLVAWWPLDGDPNGITVVEDVAGSNDGTAIGGPDPVGGMVVGALSFNGADDYVSVPDAPALNMGTGDFSIDLWLKCGSSNSGLRHIVDKRDGIPKGYTLYTNSGLLGIQLGDRDGGAVCGAPPAACTNLGGHPTNVCDNQWHHVALTVDRNVSGLLYVDGVPGNPFTNVTLRPMSLDTTTDFWIGRRQPNPAGSAPVFWLGEIDEVELFKRALTEVEVLSIYNAGSSGKCQAFAGTVTCWGADFSGQVSQAPSVNLVQISTGYDHNCGIKEVDGKLECWGSNNKLQLNHPNVEFIQVSAGFDFTCGVDTNDEIRCWGKNDNNQVGGAPTSGTFFQVDAGFNHACGTETNGDIRCWGFSGLGLSNMPSGLKFTQVVAGNVHSCGLLTGGSVVCWGDVTQSSGWTTPQDAFVQISALVNHTCGVRTNGTVICWGADGAGQQSGNPNPNDLFVDISAGVLHTCGAETDGTVTCWGSDSVGQVTSSPAVGTFFQVTAGNAHSCGLQTQ